MARTISVYWGIKSLIGVGLEKGIGGKKVDTERHTPLSKSFAVKKKKYWAQELKGDTGSTGGVEERLFHDVTNAGYVSWTQAMKEIAFCKHPL